MYNKLEALWNDYKFKKYPVNSKYKKEIEEKELFIDEILLSCRKDIACQFVPWLFDYVLLKQKIAFEAAYFLARKDNS